MTQDLKDQAEMAQDLADLVNEDFGCPACGTITGTDILDYLGIMGYALRVGADGSLAYFNEIAPRG